MFITTKQKVIIPTQVKKTVTPRYAMIHFYRERKLVSSSSSSTQKNGALIVMIKHYLIKDIKQQVKRVKK